MCRPAHFRFLVSLVVLSVLLCGTALGQEPMAPNDPAVFTKRLSLPYGEAVTTEVAKKATAAAIEEAKKNGWTIAVAVVDPGGVLVYFEKMNNTQNASPIIAIEKARTAVDFRRNTKLIEDRVVAGRVQYLGLPGAMPIEGGVPIVQGGKIVGGIAISGARSEQDGVCAKAAMDALAAN